MAFSKSMKKFLDSQVRKNNTKLFIENDPVQFVWRYKRKQDAEIVAFLVSLIAWGKRAIILRDAERMLGKLGASPYEFVMRKKFLSLGSANIHRTFFENDLAYVLRGFYKIYNKFDSLEEFAASRNTKDAWALAHCLKAEMIFANKGKTNPRVPINNAKSPLKRLNLMLRWLVRRDGIVDLGIWKSWQPSQLYIPLDVHVARTAREIGLLKRKQNDRLAAEELTKVLRQFSPEDPAKYDFTLFGLGINNDENFFDAWKTIKQNL